ncbi:DUF4177 domain-containing protein [Bradyrhizobium sp. CCBAU 11357]|uniref:DUF4177 domain-containing protein n=1 Tax=Bradyrhizobium sp. CCBAU 11357 TaxID=1630808 RepID=UPI002304CF4C|nr:DUF4177 domain-containing protein [Bradyrhizobium sp. CCBAU 11357]
MVNYSDRLTANLQRALSGEEQDAYAPRTIEILNSLGADGWELVTIARDQDGPVAFFKRQT